MWIPSFAFVRHREKNSKIVSCIGNEKVHKLWRKNWSSSCKDKEKFHNSPKLHAFTMFIKEFEPRQKLLLEWKQLLWGCGNEWRILEKKDKTRFKAQSLDMKKGTDEPVLLYKNKIKREKYVWRKMKGRSRNSECN